MSEPLSYERRLCCAIHTGQALARIGADGPLFCPLCHPEAGAREGGTGLLELCRGCDKPLPDDDPGVEAYVMHDDGGERLFLYCSRCAREMRL